MQTLAVPQPQPSVSGGDNFGTGYAIKWVTVWRLSSYVPAPITALMQHLESEQET